MIHFDLPTTKKDEIISVNIGNNHYYGSVYLINIDRIYLGENNQVEFAKTILNLFLYPKYWKLWNKIQ